MQVPRPAAAAVLLIGLPVSTHRKVGPVRVAKCWGAVRLRLTVSPVSMGASARAGLHCRTGAVGSDLLATSFCSPCFGLRILCMYLCVNTTATSSELAEAPWLCSTELKTEL